MRLLLTALTLITIIACNADKKTIVGKWKPIDLAISDMNETDKKGILDSAVVEFTADNKFYNRFGAQSTEGTYALVDSNLTVKVPNSELQQFVVSWDKSNLKLTNDQGSMIFKRN